MNYHSEAQILTSSNLARQRMIVTGESSNGLSENREKHPVDCYITELLSRARASNKDSLEKDTTYLQFCSSTINGDVNSAKIAEVKCLDLVADT